MIQLIAGTGCLEPSMKPIAPDVSPDIMLSFFQLSFRGAGQSTTIGRRPASPRWRRSPFFPNHIVRWEASRVAQQINDSLGLMRIESELLRHNVDGVLVELLRHKRLGNRKKIFPSGAVFRASRHRRRAYSNIDRSGMFVLAILEKIDG